MLCILAKFISFLGYRRIPVSPLRVIKTLEYDEYLKVFLFLKKNCKREKKILLNVAKKKN
jgi:hypothetical protein